jgi:hypothetical protein
MLVIQNGEMIGYTKNYTALWWIDLRFIFKNMERGKAARENAIYKLNNGLVIISLSLLLFVVSARQRYI